MAERLWLNPIQINIRPVATAENTIVFLCNSHEETKPEHRSEIQYPDADTRKKEPAWSWVRFMSARMVGIRGEIMIRMIKFRKKMDVRKNNGKSCDWKVSLPD